MATLSTQAIGAAGTIPTYGAASGGGDKVKPELGDRVFLHVKNGGGSPITVTLTSYATVRGQAAADRAITVAASGEKLIPVYADLNTNPADGLAAIAYSGVTTVTVAAIRN